MCNTWIRLAGNLAVIDSLPTTTMTGSACCRNFVDTGFGLCPCVIRKTALYNYDSDGSSSSSSSCSSNSSSSGSGGAETVRQQTGVCGSDDTGSEALSLLGSLDSDNNSGSSMQAGTVPVIPPFAEDDDALSSNYSSDISQLGVESGSVTHQAELYVDTESEGEQMTVALPFREGHPLSGYDLDCVNSHISATKLLTQSCPELLAGPTEFALTAEHQYSITR